MNKRDTILVRIQETYDKLSKGKKALADFLMQNPDQAAFMNAAKMGKAAGISESTVVRFAADLGYGGFAQMTEALAALVRGRISVSEQMQQTYGQMERSEILDEILRTDMMRLEQTRQMISTQAFEQAVSTLENARDIYIIGLRNSAPLAEYLYFYLRMIFNHVILISSNSDHELLEQIIHVDSRDAVFGISFPRYSLRTLRVLEFANSRQAEVITLTDTIHSPINLYASCVLTAAVDISSVAGSMTAPMGVVDALITSLSMRNSAAMMMNLELLEKTMQDYQVSGNDDMDLLEEGLQLKFPNYEGKPDHNE